MLKLLRCTSARSASIWLICLSVPGSVAALALGMAALAQQPAAQPSTASQPAQTAAPDSTAAPDQAPQASAPAQSPAAPAEPAQSAPQPAPHLAGSNPPSAPEQGGVTEDELRQMLVGKQFYLRGRYLDDSLAFNEHGSLTGRSSQGSYTLCLVQIDKVRITKHKVELIGARYGLHFLGALPYEDPTKAVDQVKITPKKKVLRITIDREVVVKPKKEKNKEKESKLAATKGTQSAAPAAGSEPADADQAKAEIAADPAQEPAADPNSTTTTSPAHATQVLKDALDNIFAPALDQRMMASMPEFWQLYYQAAAAKTDFRPQDPSVLRQNTVDTKAAMLSTFEPASNEYAQSSGVAGMALYHAVVGPDGRVSEVAVARPIGFGLDENAVAAIQKAKFSPAIKDGKPVSVMLDLVVEFRIYSKRTAAGGATEQAAKPTAPILPGPYSVEHPPQPAQGQQ